MSNKQTHEVSKLNLFDKDIKNQFEIKKKIYLLYCEEYRENFYNILILSETEFFNILNKRIILILDDIYSENIKENSKIKNVLKIVVNELKTNYYKYEYDLLNKSLKIYLEKNKIKKPKISNLSIDKDKRLFYFRNHCPFNKNYPLHSCLENELNKTNNNNSDLDLGNLNFFLPVYDTKKFNKYSVSYTNHKSKSIEKNKVNYIICILCKMVYETTSVLLYCDFCSLPFYTCIEEQSQNNIYPATWEKYHCGAIVNDQMRCIECKGLFSINLKTNKLICNKCSFSTDPMKINWNCLVCKKDFKSNAKIYNPLEYKMIKLAIKDAMLYKIPALPDDIDCCDDIIEKIKNKNTENSEKFSLEHKNECKGILYEGKLYDRKVVICSKCNTFVNYEKFIWNCPFCLKRYKKKNISPKKIKIIGQEINNNMNLYNFELTEKLENAGNLIKEKSENKNIFSFKKDNVNNISFEEITNITNKKNSEENFLSTKITKIYIPNQEDNEISKDYENINDDYFNDENFDNKSTNQLITKIGLCETQNNRNMLNSFNTNRKNSDNITAASFFKKLNNMKFNNLNYEILKRNPNNKKTRYSDSTNSIINKTFINDRSILNNFKQHDFVSSNEIRKSINLNENCSNFNNFNEESCAKTSNSTFNPINTYRNFNISLAGRNALHGRTKEILNTSQSFENYNSEKISNLNTNQTIFNPINLDENNNHNNYDEEIKRNSFRSFYFKNSKNLNNQRKSDIINENNESKNKTLEIFSDKDKTSRNSSSINLNRYSKININEKKNYNTSYIYNKMSNQNSNINEMSTNNISYNNHYYSKKNSENQILSNINNSLNNNFENLEKKRDLYKRNSMIIYNSKNLLNEKFSSECKATNKNNYFSNESNNPEGTNVNTEVSECKNFYLSKKNSFQLNTNNKNIEMDSYNSCNKSLNLSHNQNSQCINLNSNSNNSKNFLDKQEYIEIKKSNYNKEQEQKIINEIIDEEILDMEYSSSNKNKFKNSVTFSNLNFNDLSNEINEKRNNYNNSPDIICKEFNIHNDSPILSKLESNLSDRENNIKNAYSSELLKFESNNSIEMNKFSNNNQNDSNNYEKIHENKNEDIIEFIPSNIENEDIINYNYDSYNRYLNLTKENNENNDVICNIENLIYQSSIMSNEKNYYIDEDYLDSLITNKFDLEDYKIENSIGEGSYANVYLAVNKINYSKYALKKIIVDDLEQINKLVEEMNNLKELNQDNIVKNYGMMYRKLDITTYALYILMDLADSDWEKEIKNRQNKKNMYSEVELIEILNQIVSCLAFLQERNISHRDIKPNNILLFSVSKKKEKIYKISDFGEARFSKSTAGNEFYTIKGTEIFMSPILIEGCNSIINKANHNLFKSDCFSLGLCLLFAATLNINSVHEIRFELREFKKINNTINKYLKMKFTKKFILMITNMLNIEEDER